MTARKVLCPFASGLLIRDPCHRPDRRFGRSSSSQTNWSCACLHPSLPARQGETFSQSSAPRPAPTARSARSTTPCADDTNDFWVSTGARQFKRSTVRQAASSYFDEPLESCPALALSGLPLQLPFPTWVALPVPAGSSIQPLPEQATASHIVKTPAELPVRPTSHVVSRICARSRVSRAMLVSKSNLPSTIATSGLQHGPIRPQTRPSSERHHPPDQPSTYLRLPSPRCCLPQVASTETRSHLYTGPKPHPETWLTSHGQTDAAQTLPLPSKLPHLPHPPSYNTSRSAGTSTLLPPREEEETFLSAFALTASPYFPTCIGSYSASLLVGSY